MTQRFLYCLFFQTFRQKFVQTAQNSSRSADHAIGGSHGVEDGFFHCFGGHAEDFLHPVVMNGFNGADSSVVVHMAVGRGERDDNIAALMADE